MALAPDCLTGRREWGGNKGWRIMQQFALELVRNNSCQFKLITHLSLKGHKHTEALTTELKKQQSAEEMEVMKLSKKKWERRTEREREKARW